MSFLSAMVGLRNVRGAEMLAYIFLINLVAGNHTDKARGLAFFSITPE